MDNERKGNIVPDSLKMGITAIYFPDLLIANLSGCRDYGEYCRRKLGRMILGRDPIFTSDIQYDELGRIVQIGNQKVEGHSFDGRPIMIGGKKINYSLFGTPESIES